MKWQAYELHTHTPHSDGIHTLLEMAIEAKRIGLDGLALTDHNTMSGLIDKDFVEEKTGLHIVRGLEWTTFYGHMLTLGIERYEDWRNLSPIDIEKGIDRIHKQGGIVGIAHPFCIGTPICTGCFWEYEISDWNVVDYIEVWNEPFPSIKKSNIRAFELWTEKLNQGYQIAATSGRDWHKSDSNDGPPAVSYLYMNVGNNELKEAEVINAIKQGNISVSLGPLLLLSGKISIDGQAFGLGDRVNLSGRNTNVELDVQLDYSARQGKWELPDQILKIVINSNKGELTELKFANGFEKDTVNLNMKDVIWLRAELYGVFNNVRTMIAFTNPIYFSH